MLENICVILKILERSMCCCLVRLQLGAYVETSDGCSRSFMSARSRVLRLCKVICYLQQRAVPRCRMLKTNSKPTANSNSCAQETSQSAPAHASPFQHRAKFPQRTHPASTHLQPCNTIAGPSPRLHRPNPNSSPPSRQAHSRTIRRTPLYIRFRTRA